VLQDKYTLEKFERRELVTRQTCLINVLGMVSDAPTRVSSWYMRIS